MSEPVADATGSPVPVARRAERVSPSGAAIIFLIFGNDEMMTVPASLNNILEWPGQWFDAGQPEKAGLCSSRHPTNPVAVFFHLGYNNVLFLCYSERVGSDTVRMKLICL